MTTRQPRINDPDTLAAAAELVATTQFGSVAMLQRRLSIGFTDATWAMDTLEKAGVVGPARDGGPRQVLIGLNEVLSRLDEQDTIPAELINPDAIELIRSIENLARPPAQQPNPNDAVRQLTEIRGELARVDNKASSLLALAGMALTIGLTVLGRTPLPAPAAVIGWASALAVAVAVGCLARAVRPNLGGDHGYLRLAHAKTPVPAPSVSHEQLVWLACLAHRKFTKVKWAVDLLCLALAGTAGAAIVTALL
jgi:hypothetical protein